MTLQQFLKTLTAEQKELLAARLLTSTRYLNHIENGTKRVGPVKALEYARVLNMPVENVSPHIDWAAFRHYFETVPAVATIPLENHDVK